MMATDRNGIKTILILFFMLGICHTNAQKVYQLYESAIPNSRPSDNNESTTNNGVLIIKHVSIPTLTVYLPKNPGPKKSAVIICPGGGYEVLAAGHEGAEVALALNTMGITAFVLKYRLPNDSIMIDKSIGPLQDVQRAFQLVREHAAEWNLDTSKIGVMGFSAGGHLAATASTQFDRKLIDNPKNISLRPDFSILLYPVISFSDKLTHAGSRNNLVGKNPSAAVIKQFSNEQQVTPQTPPAFLVHAADDGAVPIANSIVYYEALLKNGVYSEMLLYPHGEHGFGMNNKSTADKWMDNLKNWMKANQFL